MKTRGRFIHFWGTPPNSIGFHCKAVFFHCSATPVVGVTLGELEKLIFLNTIHPFFWGTPPNSIGFHCKVGFSHCSTAPVVGVPFGELKKNIFLIQYEKKLIISGTSETIFFDTNRERPWKPREGSSIFCGIQPNSIGFHCIFFWIIVLRHQSWG